MQLIKSCSVEVLRPGKTNLDEFGNETPGEATAETVPNVVPCRGSTADLDADRPDGVTVAMTFHFPKTYTASLRGCDVRYAGREYRVIGDPQPYLDANTPGDWNRPVECEVCDG